MLPHTEVIEAKSLQVHYVSNVKAKNPIVGAMRLQAQRTARRDLKFLFALQIVNLFKRLEGNFESLLLGQFMLKVLLTLRTAHLTETQKLLLDLLQLPQDT